MRVPSDYRPQGGLRDVTLRPFSPPPYGLPIGGALSLASTNLCGTPAKETRTLSVSGHPEDWRAFDRGETVSLTKC